MMHYYKNQGGENTGWADVDNLKKLSLQISGLNTQKFNTCLDIQNTSP